MYGDVSALGASTYPTELFRNPDRDTAARNLLHLADSLGILATDIPNSLDAFSECYLSISYFERYLHAIYPEITSVVEETRELKEHRSIKDQPALQEKCAYVAEELDSLIVSTLGKIERFHQQTETMWMELTAARF